MARKTTVKVEGLKELRRALIELPKATQGAVLRRTLLKAAAPMAAKAAAMAPRDTGQLATEIDASPRLTARQRRLAGKGAVKQADGSFRSAKSTGAEVHMGPAATDGQAAPDPAGLMQEFGTRHNVAQPFMRPAWDAEKGRALETIRTELAAEIARAAQRAARTLARGGTRRRRT